MNYAGYRARYSDGLGTKTRAGLCDKRLGRPR